VKSAESHERSAAVRLVLCAKSSAWKISSANSCGNNAARVEIATPLRFLDLFVFAGEGSSAICPVGYLLAGRAIFRGQNV